MQKLKDYQPLCKIKENLLVVKKNKFYLYNLETQRYKFVGCFEDSLVARLKSINKISKRLFRADIRAAFLVNESNVIFSKDKNLYKLSIKDKKILKIYSAPKGFSHPLNISASLNNSKYIALFGDYGNNSSRDEVSIYGINADFSVEKIYIFKEGTIRHIHNIIVDQENNQYYILTGDNENASGIYITDANFKYMKPVLIGTQKSRAVVGFMTEKGLLFATDSVEEKNYIYLLEHKGNSHDLKEITEINGSCIYGTKCNNGYVFSTTVESEESTGSRFVNLLTTKRGKGILSDEVHLVEVSTDFKSKIIAVYKKDKLPYKLFQYGVVRFPTNIEEDSLIIYPQAVKKYSGNTYIF